MIGPKGLSPFDGYGIQIEGFEHRQMMTMMNYNYDYYPKLVEALGFEKEVDFVSCYLAGRSFRLPERVERIANRAMERGNLRVKNFKNKKELLNGHGASVKPITRPLSIIGSTTRSPKAMFNMQWIMSSTSQITA